MKLAALLFFVWTLVVFSLKFFRIPDDFEHLKVWFLLSAAVWVLSCSFIWRSRGIVLMLSWCVLSLSLFFIVLRTPALIGYSVDVSTSASNFPTIQDDDIIISRHFDLDYSRGVFVGFSWNNTLYRKRIHGVSGDEISLCNGKVYVNGMSLSAERKFTLEHQTDTGCNSKDEPLILGTDEFYLLGDNPKNSYDSRVFGPVKRSAIIANSLYKISSGKPGDL